MALALTVHFNHSFQHFDFRNPLLCAVFLSRDAKAKPPLTGAVRALPQQQRPAGAAPAAFAASESLSGRPSGSAFGGGGARAGRGRGRVGARAAPAHGPVPSWCDFDWLSLLSSRFVSICPRGAILSNSCSIALKRTFKCCVDIRAGVSAYGFGQTAAAHSCGAPLPCLLSSSSARRDSDVQERGELKLVVL